MWLLKAFCIYKSNGFPGPFIIASANLILSKSCAFPLCSEAFDLCLWVSGVKSLGGDERLILLRPLTMRILGGFVLMRMDKVFFLLLN